MTIRPYQNSDWPMLLHFLHETAEYHLTIQNPLRTRHYTDKVLSDFTKSMTATHRQGTGIIFMAIDESKNDQAVGFVFGKIDKMSEEFKKCALKTGIVNELYVSPTVRNQGVASQLLDHIEEWFVTQDCQMFSLHDVHTANKQARALYEKRGYIPRVIEYAKLSGGKR